MKVIQVIPNLCMGGAETMCETLTLELIKQGVDVKIVSLYDYQTPITQRLSRAGVEIEFLNKKGGMDLSIIKKLKNIFIRENPDVVHSHLGAQKYAMIAAKKARIPSRVHTVHSVADKELSRIDKILAKRFYKKHGVVPVALSEMVQETVKNVYKLPLDLVPIIVNGINLSKCLKKSDYSFGDTIKVLHIGRFSPEKNHKGLIDAFEIFHKVFPNTTLNLVGDGNTLEETKEYALEKGLKDAVCFLGMKDNVYEYINQADIFVLSSLYEGMPMTLIEAMGTGVPIVATNVGGVPNMLTNEKNALLTSVNAEEIAKALIAISKDYELRQNLGVNALARSKDFSAEKMAVEYLKIYQRGLEC